MSDFYDSLEEDDDKCSEASPSCGKGASSKPVVDSRQYEVKGPCESFFLNQVKTENKENSISNILSERSFDIGSSQGDRFLPCVKNNEQTGADIVTLNFYIDEEKLSEQGLQLNSDGSFTKSPRTELEQLPFVTREYQNLHFPKRNQNQPRKNKSLLQKNKKNIFTQREDSTSKNKEKTVGTLSARIKTCKNVMEDEEVLPSIARNLSKSEKELVSRPNLTDSMKEVLLQNQSIAIGSECIEKAQTNITGSLAKARKIFNQVPKAVLQKQKSIDNEVHTREEIFRNFKGKSDLSIQSQVVSNDSESQFKILTDKTRGGQRKTPVLKHQSDVLVTGLNTRLSYLERRQKESGFNPLHLRLGVKRVTSDTMRSNFGDSAVDKLSEVSSRFACAEENTDRENEELFYRKLIERDANQRGFNSSRSQAPLKSIKIRDLSSSDVYKDKKEERSKPRNKSFPRVTSITMPSEDKRVDQLAGRSPHFCCGNSTSTLSKSELALKAKAYGYVANARNILRLKSKTENRLNSDVSERDHKKFNREESKLASEASSLKRNLLPEISADKKGRQRPTQFDSPRSSTFLNKEEKYYLPLIKQIGFAFPYVKGVNK